MAAYGWPLDIIILSGSIKLKGSSDIQSGNFCDSKNTDGISKNYINNDNDNNSNKIGDISNNDNGNDNDNINSLGLFWEYKDLQTNKNLSTCECVKKNKHFCAFNVFVRIATIY